MPKPANRDGISEPPGGATIRQKIHLARFAVESRLLEELGERLVSKSDVAALELVKNAYDADATLVRLNWGPHTLRVTDNGHGMTKEEFETRWMRIATRVKADERRSRSLGRPLVGSKGIGRFAVRFLGGRLILKTVARHPLRETNTKLVAAFDWADLDQTSDVTQVAVPYHYEDDTDEPIGTTLRISLLRDRPDPEVLKRVRTGCLQVSSPWAALAPRRRTARSPFGHDVDPGFIVEIQASASGQDEPVMAEVLDHYVGRVTVEVDLEIVRYRVYWRGHSGPVLSLDVDYPNHLHGPCYADIRFFPRRKGTFSGLGVNGQAAATWVRQHKGVAVIDKGFRVPPYGLADDDWLHLDLDEATKRRTWRSPIMEAHFPIPDAVRADPAKNPALSLPTNWQILGAVFVASEESSERGLVASMDREGFLDNRAHKDLHNVVRAAVELLAQADRGQQQQELQRRADEAAAQARSEIRAAIQEIEASSTMAREDRTRVVARYASLLEHVDELTAYEKQAREHIEIMGLLGVVAGFMTHEFQAILHTLRQSFQVLRELAASQPALEPLVGQLGEHEQALRDYLAYSRMFLDGVRVDPKRPYKALPQIRHVAQTLKHVTDRYAIQIDHADVAMDLPGPAIPVAAYSGLFLNLLTNAIKALIVRQGNAQRIVRVSAGGDARFHWLDVEDNGVGVPPAIRSRIWDPLFTTTSDLNNPLGSGLGLGLALVMRLVEHFKGKIALVDPSAGFQTRFRVTLPQVATDEYPHGSSVRR